MLSSPFFTKASVTDVECEFISNTIPSTMIAGFTYDVEFKVKNIGAWGWNRDEGFNLYSAPMRFTISSWEFGGLVDSGYTHYYLNPIYTPSNRILTGQDYTFRFRITAPDIAGSFIYNARFQVTGLDASFYYEKAIQVDNLPLNDVTLNKHFTSIPLGETEILNYTVSPFGSNKKVNWESSNPNIASVANGVLRTFSIGTTNITVTTEDGGKTDSCIVTVIPALPSPVNLDNYIVTSSNKITKINPNMTVTDFTNSISPQSGVNLEYKNIEGVTISGNNIIGTGTTISVTYNLSTTVYTIIIYGDINGDGAINVQDLVATKSHLIRTNLLRDNNLLAGGFLAKNGVSISDLLAIKKSVLNIAPIKQDPSINKDIYVFDLENFTDDLVSTKTAYDYVKLVSTLQGLMNREKPRIYYLFQNDAVSNTFDADQYWLSKLTEEGAFLSQYNFIYATDIYEIIKKFKDYVEGIVLWDESVPSTSNVASTIAGIENLLPVRYDTAEGSLYNDLFIKHKVFSQPDIKINLVGKFTGTGTVPDSTTPSTGSAKNDAYIWAKEKYLDTGLSNPMLMTYSMDAFPWNTSINLVRNAKILSASIPEKMNPGQEVEITLTIKNIGTECWTQSEHYNLGAGGKNQFLFKNAQYGEYSTSISNQRIFINAAQTILPQEQFTFRFTIVAPNIVGDYIISTQMVQDGVAWFGEVLKRKIQVTYEQNLPLPIETNFKDDDFYYPNLLGAQLTSADYLIGNKAFFFDLSPDANSKPNDDKNQPLGTDYNTFIALLRSQALNAGRNIFTVNGFVPWAVKYTTYVDPQATLDPVPAEWKMVDIISSFNGQVDASGGVSNVSLFSKIPLMGSFKQKNDKGVSSTLQYNPNTKYIMYYMGDYDGSEWTTNALPKIWDDPRRGEIPIAWSLCPGLSKNAPQMFNYMYDTMRSNDYFVTGDNGTGYLNPMFLESDRRPSGFVDFLDVWEELNIKANNRFDIDITGFLIDGNASPVTQKVQEAYSRMTPKGVFYDNTVTDQFQGETPFMKMIGLGALMTNPATVADLLNNHIQTSSQFHAFRCVLTSPGVLADATSLFKSMHPEMNIEVVDPYTFSRLFKESQ